MHVHITHNVKRIAFHGRHQHQIGALGFGRGDRTQYLIGVPRLAKEDEDVAVGESTDFTMESVERGMKASANTRGD